MKEQGRIKIFAILCLGFLQMGFQASESEPDWDTVCETPGKYKVLSAALYLEPQRFTTEHLTRFFSKYLQYDEATELDLLVVSDPRLIQGGETAVVVDLEHPPAIEPTKVAGPIAFFRKIGRAAFFEFRNTKGQISRVALRGLDLFSPVIGRLRPVVVGDHFSSNLESDCLADTFRHVVLVVPGLEEMSPEQLSSVCRFYARHLRPIPFYMQIYASFAEAGSERRFEFPALEAMAGGFATPRKPKRVASFVSSGGKGSVTIREDGHPVWRIDVEEERP